MATEPHSTTQTIDQERGELLRRIIDVMETPMVMLGFIWLGLLILELIRGSSPLLEFLSTVIWIAFVLGFTLEIIVAPNKMEYLRHNWLTAVSIAVPALRVFRIARAFRVLRAARAARGLRLVRVLSSINRALYNLGKTFGRTGFGYALALTLVVTIAGAAGMYALEYNPEGEGLNSFPAALWWTIMLLTTIGSEYWPQTPEGRVLCVMLSFYAVAMFGYVTAMLATFLLGRDIKSEKKSLSDSAVVSLRDEIAGLREEVRMLSLRTKFPSKSE